MSNFMSISQKLEDFRRQFEHIRKNFKLISNEMKPNIFNQSELDLKLSENNRIIESLLTSISNAVDFNSEKIYEYYNGIDPMCEENLKHNFYPKIKPEKEEYEEDFSGIGQRSYFQLANIDQNKSKILLDSQIFTSQSNSESKEHVQNNLFLDRNNLNNGKVKMSAIGGPQILNLSMYNSFTNEDGKIKQRNKKDYHNKKDDADSFSLFSLEKKKIYKSYKRGPYRAYDTDLKSTAIKMMLEEGKDYRDVAKLLNVPSKNVKRWLKVGPLRKKGGGRKTMDPNMEQSLFEWCINEIKTHKRLLSRSVIKQKARLLSQHKLNFKASKGWLDKFMKRFNYSEKCRQVLNDNNDSINKSNNISNEIISLQNLKFEDDKIFMDEEPQKTPPLTKN